MMCNARWTARWARWERQDGNTKQEGKIRLIIQNIEDKARG